MTEQLTVVTSPISYDFGQLTVGQTSNAVAMQVRPSAGAQYDVITNIVANCPDFVLTFPPLPAEVIREVECESCPLCAQPAICTTIYQQNYDWTARFRPTVGQTVSCPVQFIFQNTSSNKTVTLTGTGTLPPIDIDVQPSSIAFGDVRVGTPSSARAVTVRNLGGQTLTVSNVTIPGGYSMTGATAYAVQPGGTVTHNVTCTPPTTGARNGTMVISSNDPATPTINVPLTCNGIASNLDITPSPLAIATTRVGEPRTQAITLRNTGTASMMLQSVTLQGTDIELVGAPAPNLTLGPGATTTATVRFNATASGDVSAMLNATYDGGQARTSQISARAVAASIAITPDGTVELGPVCIGHMKEQTFSVIANAEASFVISSISSPLDPFTVATPMLPATVQGAGANAVEFTVTAAPMVTGRVTSTFDVTTDIPNGVPKTIEVAVDGLTAGVSGTPELLDFGSAEPNTTSIGQNVNVSNCGTAPITTANPRIEGRNADEFAIVANPTSPTIDPVGTASWLVISRPSSAGLKEASFVVEYDGTSTVMIPLAAEGLGDGVLEPGDDLDIRPSYYACSVGTASASWPIALAVVGILRRRRRPQGAR